MNFFLHKKNSVCAAALGAAALALLPSCQDENFGYTSDYIAYKTNFERVFGTIDPDQTWDLSSYGLSQQGLTGGPSEFYSPYNTDMALTRALAPLTEGDRSSLVTDHTSDQFVVPDELLDWMNKNLTERVNHASLGSSFTLVKPSTNNFLLIPIYQGNTGMSWDLHLVDNGTDYALWRKSDGIYYDLDYTNWEEFFYASYNPGHETDTSWPELNGQYPMLYKLWNAFPDMGDVTDGDVKIRFSVPAGYDLEVSFYTVSDNKATEVTPLRTSIDNNTGQSNIYQDVDLTAYANDNGGRGAVRNLYVKFDGTAHVDAFDTKRVKIYTYCNKTISNVELDANRPGKKGGTFNEDYYSFFTGHTIGRTKVRSEAMEIKKDALSDKPFYLYLDILTKNNDGFAAQHARQRSDAARPMMIALNTPNLVKNGVDPVKHAIATTYSSLLGSADENSINYILIGCEDANTDVSDWDYNDVVFLLVGLPGATNVRETIRKRYLIEDLGSTFDFDFNDIVVDLTEDHLRQPDGTITQIYNQTATISHLCGTIPFQVNIGTYSFPVMNGQNNNDSPSGFDPLTSNEKIGSDVNTTYQEACRERVINVGSGQVWDAKNNNIIVTVWPKNKDRAEVVDKINGNGGNLSEEERRELPGAKNIGFPDRGALPYIIAVDPSVPWRKELATVPSSWFNTWPISYPAYDEGSWVYDDHKLDEVNVGKEFKYTAAEAAENGNHDIPVYLQSFLRNTENGKYVDGAKVTLTFVVPPHSTVYGKITGQYPIWFQLPGNDPYNMVNDTDQPKNFKIVLDGHDETFQAALDAIAWYQGAGKNNNDDGPRFRFTAYGHDTSASPKMNLFDPTASDENRVRIFVKYNDGPIISEDESDPNKGEEVSEKFDYKQPSGSLANIDGAWQYGTELKNYTDLMPIDQDDDYPKFNLGYMLQAHRFIPNLPGQKVKVSFVSVPDDQVETNFRGIFRTNGNSFGPSLAVSGTEYNSSPKVTQTTFEVNEESYATLDYKVQWAVDKNAFRRDNSNHVRVFVDFNRPDNSYTTETPEQDGSVYGVKVNPTGLFYKFKDVFNTDNFNNTFDNNSRLIVTLVRPANTSCNGAFGGNYTTYPEEYTHPTGAPGLWGGENAATAYRITLHDVLRPLIENKNLEYQLYESAVPSGFEVYVDWDGRVRNTSLPRTLWTGIDQHDNWDNATTVPINLNSVNSDDVHTNLMMRVYANKKDNDNDDPQLNINSGNVYPVAANEWGNFTNRKWSENTGWYFNVPLDNSFLAAIKANKTLTLNGKNIIITKVEFCDQYIVPLNQQSYDQNNDGISYDANTKTITFTKNNWAGAHSILYGSFDYGEYNKAYLEIESLTKTGENNPNVNLTIVYNDNTQSQGYGTSKIEVTLDANKKKNIKQIWVQASDPCTLKIKEIYFLK